MKRKVKMTHKKTKNMRGRGVGGKFCPLGNHFTYEFVMGHVDVEEVGVGRTHPLVVHPNTMEV